MYRLFSRSFSSVPPSLSTAEIRSSFLDFFASGRVIAPHRVYPSSSLIPAASSSSSSSSPDFSAIHFTNAGMVQFKDVFLGKSAPPSPPRATSSQLCLRAGGKHNDLDNVGYTARHHTLFEMLGNFSFADYGKEGAILAAWSYLTGSLKLPESRLRVTVFESDDESARLWQKVTGWKDQSKIIRMGRADNYWSMGAGPGPCGPCTEIFWDQGKEVNGDRWLEIWNLVFMQFEQTDKAGEEIPLGKTSVDTGMGLERIAAVLQGVDTNYDTDGFKPLVAKGKEIFPNRAALANWHGMDSSPASVALKVVIDHIRAIAFLISDGVKPGNKGRQYVLRRIIRRAMSFAFRQGITQPVLTEFLEPLIHSMGGQYPQLVAQREHLIAVIRAEEKVFLASLQKGIKLLEQAIDKRSSESNRQLPGDLVFLLYDTYGFPFDLTSLIAREKGFTVDEAGFEAKMNEQRARAKANYEKTAKIN